jgi:protein SCO1/2
VLLTLALVLAVPGAYAQQAAHEHAKQGSAAHGRPASVAAMKEHTGHEDARHASMEEGQSVKSSGMSDQAGHEHAAQGHGEHDHGSHDHSAHAAAPKKAPLSAADIDLRDRTLLDQDGREVDFVSDVLGERIVVMDFVFTTCTNVCPILSAVLAQVQDSLGDSVGRDVALVSLTVDPVRDTPQRLKAYSAKHRAGGGWTWLTGNKSAVEDVLIGLGAYSVNFEDHPPMVVVGDRKTGQWSRFFGFPSPKRIVEQVEALQAARRAAAGS